MDLMDKLKSVITDLSALDDKVSYITAHQSGPSAILWDLATVYTFIDQYLHPTTVDLTFSRDTAFTISMKWPYPAYDFIMYLEGTIGATTCSLSLKYPNTGGVSLFQWTPGDLPVAGLFNFFSIAFTNSRATLSEIYENLSDKQHFTAAYDLRFTRIMGEALFQILPVEWYMAPVSEAGNESFIGGLYRRSVTVGLNMFTLASRQVSMLNKYYHGHDPSALMNRYIFQDGPVPSTPNASAIYPLAAFCYGVLKHANDVDLFRVRHTAVLALSQKIYAPSSISTESYRTLFWMRVKELLCVETEDTAELNQLYLFFKNLALSSSEDDPFPLFWMYSSKWNKFVEVTPADQSSWTITDTEGP